MLGKEKHSLGKAANQEDGRELPSFQVPYREPRSSKAFIGKCGRTRWAMAARQCAELNLNYLQTGFSLLFCCNNLELTLAFFHAFDEPTIFLQVKHLTCRAWRDGSRALLDLQQDLSSVPRTHTGKLVVTCNSSPTESDPLFWLCGNP